MDANKNGHGGPFPIYFYCSRNQAEPERTDPDRILRCLLRQSFSSPRELQLHHILEDRFGKKDSAGDIGMGEAMKLLCQSIEIRPVTYILVDALDECKLDDRRKLIQCLKEVLRASSTIVKILIASRENPDIYKRLGQCPEVQLNSSQNEKDIEVYVETKVQQEFHDGMLLPEEEAEVVRKELTKIKTRLREGAKGM
jgi:hypothetical protein